MTGLHPSLRWPRFGTAVLLLAFASALDPPAVQAERLEKIVGPGVEEALREERGVRVVIAFRPPERVAGRPSARISEIGRIRRRSLARLAPGEFTPLEMWSAISAAAGTITRAGLEKLASDLDVLRIDLDAPGGGHLAESVPLIGASVVHGRGFTGRGITAAVLDTGVDLTHSDLADDLVGEQCFCTNVDGSGCCPNGTVQQSGVGSGRDAHGHGTNVAGIITSAGRVAPAGVAPNTKVVAIRVLDSQNRFSGTSQIVSALNWLIMNRPDVRIVNMSLGTDARFFGACDTSTAFTMAMADAVNSLSAGGVTTFASSGNSAATGLEAPACLSGVVSVGAVYDANIGSRTYDFCSDATTTTDQIACFTNRNATLDLLAPGVLTRSAGLGGGTSNFAGTSQASPHAAGAAALLLEARPGLTPPQIEATLKNSGRLVNDPASGLSFPRLNALGALDSILGTPSVCMPGPNILCLSGGRFRVEVSWRAVLEGTSGVGTAVSLSSDTGYFWFFMSTNVELVVKVLDARVINGKFWVFYGALSNVEYTITVTDTATGVVKTYFNPQNTQASFADTAAF